MVLITINFIMKVNLFSKLFNFSFFIWFHEVTVIIKIFKFCKFSIICYRVLLFYENFLPSFQFSALIEEF